MDLPFWKEAKVELKLTHVTRQKSVAVIFPLT